MRGKRPPISSNLPLVLDFDGVVCDSLKESLLVVWNGAGGNPPVEFSVQGLLALPSDFVERLPATVPLLSTWGTSWCHYWRMYRRLAFRRHLRRSISR